MGQNTKDAKKKGELRAGCEVLILAVIDDIRASPRVDWRMISALVS